MDGCLSEVVVQHFTDVLLILHMKEISHRFGDLEASGIRSGDDCDVGDVAVFERFDDFRCCHTS